MERIQKMNVPYMLYQLWSAFSQSCLWGVRWGVNIPFFGEKHVKLNYNPWPCSSKLPQNMLSNITKSCWSSLVVLYSQNYLAGICGHYYESSVCLEYTKKFLPKQINLQNFLTPKNLGIKNFKPQTILRSLLSLEIWSTPRELSQASFSKQDKVRSLWNESSIIIIFIILV